MNTTTHPARRRGYLSRRERLQLARAEAFSRRTGTDPLHAPPVTFTEHELEVIDRLVRGDRTAVSRALLAVTGIGSGELMRGAVLARVGEAARSGPGAERDRFEASGADRAAHPARAAQPARCRAGWGEGSLMTLSTPETTPPSTRSCDSRTCPAWSLGAPVSWSDGAEAEASRWYGDEVLVCEGDLIGQRWEQLRALDLRRGPDWLRS